MTPEQLHLRDSATEIAFASAVNGDPPPQHALNGATWLNAAARALESQRWQESYEFF
jgi:hypothetical protein